MILDGAFISLSKHFFISLSLSLSLSECQSGQIDTTNQILSSQKGTLLQQETKSVDLQGSNGGSQHKLIHHAFAKTLSKSRSKGLLLH